MSVHALPLNSQELRPQATDASVAPTPAVAVEALEKTYELRPILRGLTFTLEPGRCLALLGPNGAGKTTLLRILATLIKPSQGRALVQGLDVRRDAQAVRRTLGYVGHQPLLYDELTARENLLFFARMYGVEEAESRADALLARVGLAGRANERARVFSRGQVQRLSLARGIIHSPMVLLLDEPDTGLDDDAVALLSGLVRERRAAGLATILTTHNLERGLSLGDEALVLLGGHAAYSGPARDLDAAAVRDLYTRHRERSQERRASKTARVAR